MKSKFFGVLCALCVLCFSMSAVYATQSTEGNELNVAEAQQLNIQLGPQWVGVEFMLRTDAGVYPNLIPVDKTGMLSLEIGGSKSYTLSCMQSSVTAPELLLQAPVTTEAETIAKESVENTESKDTPLGIPISHLVMFIAGILIAAGILVALHISNKNRQIVQDDEDEDDF